MWTKMINFSCHEVWSRLSLSSWRWNQHFDRHHYFYHSHHHHHAHLHALASYSSSSSSSSRWNVSDRAGRFGLRRRRRWRGEPQSRAQQTSSCSHNALSNPSSSPSFSLSTTSKATLSPRGLRGGDAPSPKRVGSRSLGADNDLITSSLLGTSASSSWSNSFY